MKFSSNYFQNKLLNLNSILYLFLLILIKKYNIIFKKYIYIIKADIRFYSSDSKLFLGSNVTLSSGVRIISNSGKISFEGDNYVNFNTIISSIDSIIIGKNTTIGPNVLIYDHDHKFRDTSTRGSLISKPVNIGRNVWISAGVIILKGVSIGDNSIIAAGAIVTKDIPSNTIYKNKITGDFSSL